MLVSGAAGAVGSAVGQLARQWGAKLVVGTAGGAEKCALVVNKFGFDACIDYKKFDTQEKVAAELKRLSPEGFDVYFDNTGGHVTDAFFDATRKYSRMALCGSIANYNDEKPKPIPNFFLKCIYTSVRIQGKGSERHIATLRLLVTLESFSTFSRCCSLLVCVQASFGVISSSTSLTSTRRWLNSSRTAR